MMDVVELELLVVPDCPKETPTARLVRQVLDELGLTSTTVRTTVIRTLQEARLRRFVGSPTILINGVDPFAEPGRLPALACRVYRTGPGFAGMPNRHTLRQALLAAKSEEVSQQPC